MNYIVMTLLRAVFLQAAKNTNSKTVLEYTQVLWVRVTVKSGTAEKLRDIQPTSSCKMKATNIKRQFIGLHNVTYLYSLVSETNGVTVFVWKL